MTLPITIDTHDPTPIYAQLDRAIRFGIASGHIAAGDQLPTVRQLAVDLSVNANTVAKVYLALERDGVVATKRGVGTFVLEPRKEALHVSQRKEHLKTLTAKFLREAAALGFSPAVVIEYLRHRIEKGD
jgi:GntR family transcriptional regulator